MFNLIFMLFIIMLILIFMLVINFILSKKSMKNLDKMMPFECGFEPMIKNLLPFSLQFYLISVIFLIFDIEISLILPMVKFMNLNYFNLILNSMIIMLILIFGLLIEWNEGALMWFK